MIDTSAVTSKGLACALIDKLMRRREAGLSTPKQIRFLSQYGLDAANWSFFQASGMINRLVG